MSGATLARRRSDESFVPTLQVSTRTRAGAIEVAIRDNGTGMPPDVVERVFSPFFTTKPAGEGVGFGLSVAHDVVTKLHGGELLCASEAGAWSEFTIRLPIAPASVATTPPLS